MLVNVKKSEPASTTGAKFSVAQIPTLRDVSEDVVKIEEKIARLTARRAELDTERNALWKESTFSAEASNRLKLKDAAILATALGTPTPAVEDLSAHHSRVVEQIRVIDAALRMLRDDLIVAQTNASDLICRQVVDVHKSLIKEIVRSLLAANKACCEYEDFADALNGRGIAWSQMTPCQPRFLGHPRDNYSPLAWYLRDLADRKQLDRDEIPEAIRWG